MTPDPYGSMELLRLSPSNGQTLRRLNLIQGQILHGRVFKMEPYGPAGPDLGGVAKIALGSHIIDANVSRSIPEGSHVTLEVVRISDDSFILKLIAVEEPGSSPAGIAARPDEALLSILARDASVTSDPRLPAGTFTPSQSDESLSALTSKLVDLPKWDDLPKPVANLLRAALNQGFLNPSGFTTRGFTIRGELNQAIIELQNDLALLTDNVPPASKTLAESVESLIGIIRPMIPTLPGGDIEVSESSPQMVTALKEFASVLKALEPPVIQPGTVPTSSTAPTGSDPKAATQPSAAQPGQVSTNVQPAPLDGKPIAAYSTDAVTSRPGPVDITLPPAVPSDIPLPGTEPTVPGQVPAPLDSKIPVPPGESPATKDSPGQVSDKSDSQSQPSTTAQENSTRNLLLGIRVLANLVERMSIARGWNIEHSATLANHAGQLTSLADALEGTLIAPLLTRAGDIPDMVPRLLINLLFPGGSAELAVLQPDGSRYGSQPGSSGPGESDDESSCTGIIRLTTEGLGKIGVKLNYSQIDEKPVVSGFISTSTDVADDIRASLPSLERSLDARGIDAGAIQVRTYAAPRSSAKNSIASDTRNRFSGEPGGLDIKI